MSKLEFEYFEIEDMIFHGDEVKVHLPTIDECNIGKLWDDVMNVTDTDSFKVSDFTIGFEDYTNMTKENQTFIYRALVPANLYKGEAPVKLTLTKGKYIKFKSLFKDHGPKFFQQVYKYMADEKIAFEDGYDFELMYGDFDPISEDAVCYVCLKIKE